MSTKEKAIAAIQSLPEEAGMVEIMREIAFVTGVEDAREEIMQGKGLNAEDAKAQLREWISE